MRGLLPVLPTSMFELLQRYLHSVRVHYCSLGTQRKTPSHTFDGHAWTFPRRQERVKESAMSLSLYTTQQQAVVGAESEDEGMTSMVMGGRAPGVEQMATWEGADHRLPVSGKRSYAETVVVQEGAGGN